MTLLGKLAAVLAAMFTGALWYSPALFGRAWVAAAHPEFSFDVMMKGVERMMAAQKVKYQPVMDQRKPMMVSIFSSITTAVLFDQVFFAFVAPKSAAEALVMAVALWVVVFSSAIVHRAWGSLAQRSVKLVAIESSHDLAALVVQAVVLYYANALRVF